MAGSGSKWLKGCGIGCGIIVLLLIVVAVFGFFLVRRAFKDFHIMEASFKELQQAHGPAGEYCPAADGGIPADRLQRFIAIRRQALDAGQELIASIDSLSKDIPELDKQEDPSAWKVLGVVRRAVGALPEMARYVNARNAAMLEKEMGLGEYYYLYSVCYYAFSGHSPQDGPRLPMRQQRKGAYFSWSTDAEDIEDFEQGPDAVTKEDALAYWNSFFVQVLENQLQAARSAAGAVDGRWPETLAAEIKRLKDNPGSYPWQDGLPPVIAQSLTPTRQDITDTYQPVLNAVEVLFYPGHKGNKAD